MSIIPPPSFQIEMSEFKELLENVKMDMNGLIPKIPFTIIQIKDIEMRIFYEDLYDVIGILQSNTNRFHQLDVSPGTTIPLSKIPNGFYIFFSNKDASETNIFTTIEEWEMCRGIVLKF
jgi:hypothetical protein